ncbi:hypothetical protein JTE90_003888 [Oedothorax gibbosus]|uniref:Uncharacterized protein n=1 Tax=Oedothorax gibbosus TaxID=931172 RepID=A0AAV6UJV9_9ARAC|nr:hypothetical protein JTE90_003888 [Oedothorax gibbosus]
MRVIFVVFLLCLLASCTFAKHSHHSKGHAPAEKPGECSKEVKCPDVSNVPGAYCKPTKDKNGCVIACQCIA